MAKISVSGWGSVLVWALIQSLYNSSIYYSSFRPLFQTTKTSNSNFGSLARNDSILSSFEKVTGQSLHYFYEQNAQSTCQF